MADHTPEPMVIPEGFVVVDSTVPKLLKAACIGWDALGVLLESTESTLSEDDRAQGLKAIDRLFEINEELNGLIVVINEELNGLIGKQEDTRN